MLLWVCGQWARSTSWRYVRWQCNSKIVVTCFPFCKICSLVQIRNYMWVKKKSCTFFSLIMFKPLFSLLQLLIYYGSQQTFCKWSRDGITLGWAIFWRSIFIQKWIGCAILQVAQKAIVRIQFLSYFWNPLIK